MQALLVAMHLFFDLWNSACFVSKTIVIILLPYGSPFLPLDFITSNFQFISHNSEGGTELREKSQNCEI